MIKFRNTLIPWVLSMSIVYELLPPPVSLTYTPDPPVTSEIPPSPTGTLRLITLSIFTSKTSVGGFQTIQKCRIETVKDLHGYTKIVQRNVEKRSQRKDISDR